MERGAGSGDFIAIAAERVGRLRALAMQPENNHETALRRQQRVDFGQRRRRMGPELEGVKCDDGVERTFFGQVGVVAFF